MSYLLDALNQSQTSGISAEQYDLQAEQLKQQKILASYRRLTFIFGGALIVVFTVAAGFFVGKWLQTASAEQAIPLDKKPVEIVTEKDTLRSTDSKLTAPKPKSNTLDIVQGQVVYVQTANGIQPMLLTPQGQYMPMAVNLQSDAHQEKQQPVIEAEKQGEKNKKTSSAELDMRKYKVLGKPLNEEKYVEHITDSPEPSNVSNTLENAFAEAVKNTEEANDYEVTQGTYRSSRVQPIELLPDGLQALLPPIKYQAHIYSSTVAKRWIKLNGVELHEGDKIGQLKLLEITPEQSVLDLDGYEFSLKALQDWSK